MKKIEIETVKNHYNMEVEKYAKATFEIGLWKSEEYIFDKYFNKDSKILDLGCGTGRTTFALYERGYKNIIGLDLTPNMIKEAKNIAKAKGVDIDFVVGNALNLRYMNASFDNALFSFNGLMQIPKKSNRIKALKEIRRILRPNGFFIFTTHDRDKNKKFINFWREEKKRWESGSQNERLYEFGDRLVKPIKEEKVVFIHIPTRSEIFDYIAKVDFEYVEDFYRNNLFQEMKEVDNNTNDCCFWVVKKNC